MMTIQDYQQKIRALEKQHNELRDALQGIIDIGKRDTTNPKYGCYYRTAKEMLKKYAK